MHRISTNIFIVIIVLLPKWRIKLNIIFVFDQEQFYRLRSKSCTDSTARILEMASDSASVAIAIKREDRPQNSTAIFRSDFGLS